MKEKLFKLIMKVDWYLNKLGISISTFFFNDFAEIKKSGLNYKNSENIFQDIYEKNFWKSQESISGHGSEKKRANPYLKELEKFLIDYKIKTFLDVPCGDLNWIYDLIKKKEIDYIGADIVKDLIKKNKIKYSSLKFELIDITKDKLPKADILHCRDCLFHFSYIDIKKTINNFLNSEIDYFLITSHEGLFKNNDIITGGSRFISLLKKPFFFPKPTLKIKDYPFLFEMPRYLYLYKKEDLKKNFEKIKI